MNEIEKTLKKMDCPLEIQTIIDVTLKEIKQNPEAPISTDIQNSIDKVLKELVKDED